MHVQTAYEIYALSPATFAKYAFDGNANKVFVLDRDTDSWNECSKQAVQADLERLVMRNAHRLREQGKDHTSCASLAMACTLLRQFCLADGFAVELKRNMCVNGIKRNPFR
mmetsp:Transcript_36533/g.86768  ORF Transcript_36533/g.86768 Transcript_36533/m.86768 type:complete len:111 (-) Transcript_36533:2316-2648(-)